MQLFEMNWPQVAALSKHTPIVFPVAALEQHGHHMPVSTDSMLTAELIRRADAQLGDRVVFAPTLWLGNSDHHLDFPGTLSADPRTYLNILGDLLENFIAHGFRRLVFINGHGGNDVPGKQTVFEVRQRHRNRKDLLLLFATYWLLGARPWEVNPDLKQQRMGHACEWETSMMLRIAPQLVGDLSKVEAVDFGVPFDPASRGWIMPDRSVPGHIGDPRHATAEKGETLFQVFSSEIVKMLERVLAWNGSSWNG